MGIQSMNPAIKSANGVVYNGVQTRSKTAARRLQQPERISRESLDTTRGNGDTWCSKRIDNTAQSV